MLEKMEQTYGALSPEQIQAFEKRTGVTLPESYRAFLLRSNGGHPVPCKFAIPKWHGRFSAINVFFGIQTGTSEDLEKQQERYSDRIPDSFLPIGIDSGGNRLCLGIKG